MREEALAERLLSPIVFYITSSILRDYFLEQVKRIKEEEEQVKIIKEEEEQ